jgi:hypothetical protein
MMKNHCQVCTSTSQPGNLLTEKQTAELLQIKPNTLAVWRLHARYPLPFIRIGRTIRYRSRDVEQFLQQRQIVVEGDER